MEIKIPGAEGAVGCRRITTETSAALGSSPGQSRGRGRDTQGGEAAGLVAGGFRQKDNGRDREMVRASGASAVARLRPVVPWPVCERRRVCLIVVPRGKGQWHRVACSSLRPWTLPRVLEMVKREGTGQSIDGVTHSGTTDHHHHYNVGVVMKPVFLVTCNT